jgi:membrane protein
MIYFAFAALYYYSLESKKGYKFFSAGASLATILFLVSTEAFILYIKFFPLYNALYGSIGVLILLFLWIYISCFSILIGFELNASISDAYKEKHGEDALSISRTAITTNPQKKVKRLINKIIIKYNKYNKK